MASVLCKRVCDSPIASCLPLLIAKRCIPARGSKPLPRHLWDQDDLKTKTNGCYTYLPLQIHRLGGRDPNTGRKVNQHIGGGVKFDYFMVDFHRHGPAEANAFYEERVIEVRRDPNRTCLIALVAGWHGKRWILATENMKAGQIIGTTSYIPENPHEGIEGNAYPLGALTVGTLVNSVERFPFKREYPTSDSNVFVVQAGTCAEVIRHQGEYVTIRLPYKHEFLLSKHCMATVGRLSHADIHTKQFGSAQMHRRFGYKMSSGLFQKKDGYGGRKIRRLPAPRILYPDGPEPERYSITLTTEQKSGLKGNAKMHHLLHAGYNNRVYPDTIYPDYANAES